MDAIFESLNSIFKFITPVSDCIWDFPTNYSWWRSIPVLGNMTLAVMLLVGSGIFFTVRTGFIQVTHFKDGIRAIARKSADKRGISPAAAFFLSTAMRVGPGNIIGVTGAITTGGPGALFWMWVSAFFGMATAYTESVLAQIFKRRDGDEFVGGLPFYGRKLLRNSAFAGVFLTVLYLLYAFCSSINSVRQPEACLYVTGASYDCKLDRYWVARHILIFYCICLIGGVKKVTKEPKSWYIWLYLTVIVLIVKLYAHSPLLHLVVWRRL